MLQKATALLQELGQTHLLEHMQTLPPAAQSAMAAQIAELDFSACERQTILLALRHASIVYQLSSTDHLVILMSLPLKFRINLAPNRTAKREA